MSTEFSMLNLHPQLVQAVSERGYTEATPIQEAVIPLMLSGQDVIGQAQTGTGKTAAFALPILHKLDRDINGIQAIVLCPTRELAIQVARAVHEYGKFSDVRVLPVYGGTPYGRQIHRLKRGVDVVVGTPGRIIDLIQRKVLDLSQVSTVVLDEADEMLSMGFVEDIETILAQTPSQRQTTLFSATVPPPIRKLAQKYMDNPESVTIKNKQLTVAAIEQRYYLVNEEDKLAALTRLFEVEPITSALIFARTRQGTGELANELNVRGFPAEVLNGDLSQEARERVLNRFRKTQIKVLVATDVAARGLDIDDISHVFNFDLPQDSEIYVHRVGRTGRAGRTGVAISLITPKEQWRLRKIESYTRQKMTQTDLPTEAQITALRSDELQERMMVWLRRGRCSQEREMVEKLVAEGNDAMEIAAAALKLARAEEKQRPIAPIGELRQTQSRGQRTRKPRQNSRNGNGRSNDSRNGNGNGNGSNHSNGRSNRSNGSAQSNSHEKGMVRMQLSMGKKQGVRPNDVVGTIAYHANIPGRSLGAILIEPHHTLVDVPEQFVPQVLGGNGSYQIRKQEVTIQVNQ